MSPPRKPLAVIVAVAAMTLVGLPVAIAIGGTGWWLLKSRLAVLALLLVAQGVALSASNMRETAPRLAPLGWLLVLSAAVGVLGGRDLDGPDTSMGWTCSLLYFRFGLVPLTVIAWTLRHFTYQGWRAFTAGLGVATVGLSWGELRCQRSIGHVLVHHFGAALLLLGACMLASRLTGQARSRNPGLPA